MYRKSFPLLLTILFNLTLFAQITSRPVYPIIFVHGLVGSDETFGATMEYMRDTLGWGTIYAYDIVLNADDDFTKSDISDCEIASISEYDEYPECDVRWEPFTFGNDFIQAGDRSYNGSPDNYDFLAWDYNNPSIRIFAINFKEERIIGAEELNDHFDQSNQAAIFKQGYALSKMIDKVLDFTGLEKVILVGHSMGGLAIREYLQRRDSDGNRKWYDDEGLGHRVAHVVTIGTPHLGSNSAPDPTRIQRSEFLELSELSESLRDLNYSFDSYSDECNEMDPVGIYLFGGYENCIQDNSWFSNFYNVDVNCNNNHFDYIEGLNVGTSDNIEINLPVDLTYCWITSDVSIGESALLLMYGFAFDIESFCLTFPGLCDTPGDGAVLLQRQYLYQDAQVMPIGLADTLLTHTIHTSEGGEYTSILRGLDEPDSQEHAYVLSSSQINIPADNYLNGHLTVQSNMDQGELETLDTDFYSFIAPFNGETTVSLYNVWTLDFQFSLFVFNNNGELVSETFDSTEGQISFQVSESIRYYFSIQGNAHELTYEHPYFFRIDVEEELVIEGCTDPVAINFDPDATEPCNGDNSCCEYNEGLCTDIDGNVYETVIIGDQEWMAENLKVTHYNNGDEIPTNWPSYSGAYAVYDDDLANAEIYGNLYNWHAGNDDREICPEGWHVPSDDEWTVLTDFLGESAGSQLAGNVDLWNSGQLVDNSAFGSSGFLALPGGYRTETNGLYYSMGNGAYFWSSTAHTSSNYAWDRRLVYNNSGVNRSSCSMRRGLSVRCVAD